MRKKVISVFTLFFFMVSLFSITFSGSVKAYQNQCYFSNLKIGLLSMASDTLTATLSGDYFLNGSTVFSGTCLNFKITNGNVNINGTEYSSVNLVPLASANLLSITSGTRNNKYLGSFSFKIDNGKILPINSIYIEDYLKGVIGFEMSDSFPVEALKAQAVAARNYALSRIGYCAAKEYDFDDTTNYQVYGGFNAASKNVITAVDSTKGQILLYNDKLVETLYGSSDGGCTEDAVNVWGNPAPYLLSKPDSYDNQSWPNGNVVLSNSQIDAALKAKKYLTSTDTFTSLDLSSIARYISGRVSNINVIYANSAGTSVTLPITMDKARTFLSLPSSNYTVTYDPTTLSYTFSGKGCGHGLGMSQIGAMNRSKAGQAYDQILKFYYDGSYLQNIIKTASIQGFTANKNSLILGDSVTLNAAAQGGNGLGYLYKYVISKDNSVVYTSDYSNSAVLNYTPSDAGQYTASLYVKDNFSVNSYDAKQDVSFTVYNLPVISSVNASGYMYAGKSVSLSTSASPGSPSGLSYRYEVYKNGILFKSDSYSSSSSFSFTPDTDAVYSVTAYVKDSLSNNSFDSKKQFNLTISKVPLSVNSLPIYWGMRNTDVKTIQNALNNLGYNVGTVDGIFGQKTYTGLVNFQKAYGLTASGAVYQSTFNALNNALIIKAGLKKLTF